METDNATDSLLTRPEVIKRVRSKELVDSGVRSGALRVIRVGKEGSRRPRYLFRPEDVDLWLLGLTERETA